MPAAAAGELAARLARLRETLAPDGRIRWVAPGSMHLTLRFLGSTPPSQLPAVEDAVGEAARAVGPFEIGLGRIRTLPGRGASVLVCDVEHGADAVRAIEASLSDALDAAGWPPERRPFTPHVTLARVGRQDRAHALHAFASADASGVRWRVDAIELVESHLGAGPPRYEALVVERLVGRTAPADSKPASTRRA